LIILPNDYYILKWQGFHIYTILLSNAQWDRRKANSILLLLHTFIKAVHVHTKAKLFSLLQNVAEPLLSSNQAILPLTKGHEITVFLKQTNFLLYKRPGNPAIGPQTN